MKVTVELDDLKFSFDDSSGQIKLSAKDIFEGIEAEFDFSKVVSLRQMAAILFASSDESFESVEQIHEVANEALKGFEVAIIR